MSEINTTNEDFQSLLHSVPTKRGRRPIKERRENFCIRLTESESKEIREIGGGSISEGVRTMLSQHGESEGISARSPGDQSNGGQEPANTGSDGNFTDLGSIHLSAPFPVPMS